MKLYNTSPAIPDRAPTEETGAPAKPGPDGNTVIGGSPPPPPPSSLADEAAPRSVHYVNGSWAVTDVGLESVTMAGDPPRLVEYVIDKERLLKKHYTGAGVSDWAMHLAGKSWVIDPDGMLTALEAAMQPSPPGPDRYRHGGDARARDRRMAAHAHRPRSTAAYLEIRARRGDARPPRSHARRSGC